jgi:uncharacterized Zn-binding protein involved in type VI secretion
MTDYDRLLKHMKAGMTVCPTDWNGPEPIDGGKPVLRVAARICEMRAAGLPVERVGTRNACAVYGWVQPGQRAA